MTDAETVLVQATTDYLEGSEHKSERSAPYQATRSHGLELQAQGFAVIVDAEPAAAPAEPVAPAPAASVALVAPADPVAPRRRGRPPGRRA